MGYRVLAVDDSLLMRKQVERLLKGRDDYELAGTACNGEEAVAKFKELAPDVVLLDIVMPKKSGKDALREILEHDPKARVIMVSSLGTDEAVSECLEVGALRFIQKPFTQELLLQGLRSAVDRS